VRCDHAMDNRIRSRSGTHLVQSPCATKLGLNDLPDSLPELSSNKKQERTALPRAYCHSLGQLTFFPQECPGCPRGEERPRPCVDGSNRLADA
jgi:hypothetical protein